MRYTEPFYFPGNKTGCLLIHGFTGSPGEMRPLGSIYMLGVNRPRYSFIRPWYYLGRYAENRLVWWFSEVTEAIPDWPAL